MECVLILEKVSFLNWLLLFLLSKSSISSMELGYWFFLFCYNFCHPVNSCPFAYGLIVKVWILFGFSMAMTYLVTMHIILVAHAYGLIATKGWILFYLSMSMRLLKPCGNLRYPNIIFLNIKWPPTLHKVFDGKNLSIGWTINS